MNIDLKLDLKELNKLIKISKDFYKVKVGVLSNGNFKDNKSRITVAGYGYVNEMGSKLKQIPKRSFILAPLLLNLKNEIIKHKEKINNLLLKEKQILKAYELLGLISKSIILNTFTNNKWIPNKPSTIKKKKSSRPLIDTGRLRQSINYEVVNAN